MSNERLVWFNRGKIDPVILRYDEEVGHCYFCSSIFNEHCPRVVLLIPVYPSEQYYIAGKFSCCSSCASSVDETLFITTTCSICETSYPITQSELEYRGDAEYMCPDCVYSFYGKRVLKRYQQMECAECNAPNFFDVSIVEPTCNFCYEYGTPIVKYEEDFPAVIYEGTHGRILVRYQENSYEAFALASDGDIFSAVLTLLWSRK